MPERLINLTERQIEILRVLLSGEQSLVQFDASDASHLVIMKERGLVDVYMGGDDRVTAGLTEAGSQLAAMARSRSRREMEGQA